MMSVKLSSVAVCMLGANMVVRTINSPLEHRPVGLNRVGGHLSPGVLTRSVGNRFVGAVDPLVGLGFVSIDRINASV